MKPDYSLYLVLDPEMCGGFDAAIRLTQQVLDAGVTMIQLRAPEWKKRDWLRLSERLLPLTRDAGVPYLINDHLDIALACDADGVHLGQQDLPLSVARRLLGRNKILGLSLSKESHLNQDDFELADYFGVGPIFRTTTKQDADPVIGLETLNKWNKQLDKPIVAIGGIMPTHIPSLMQTGIAGIAVVSAICAATNPIVATWQLKESIIGAYA